jgi:type III restriction enzyme
MLKHSDNTISRRQEVGRGLRLCVDQHGNRMDDPAVVHDINVLTVVASESYREFVAGLQREICETLSSRPRQATEAYFTGKSIATEAGPVEITAAMARLIHRYLVRNDYVDDADQIATAYRDAKDAGTLAALPDELKPHAAQIFQLVDNVFSDSQLPKVGDGRRSKADPPGDDFAKFQELSARIDRSAAHRIKFDTDELIRTCIRALNSRLRVTRLQYTVSAGTQRETLTDAQLREGAGFACSQQAIHHADGVTSLAKYDLLGSIAANTGLTRRTAAAILAGMRPRVFDQFKPNPERFIAEASRLIFEQKAAMIIERLNHDEAARSTCSRERVDWLAG